MSMKLVIAVVLVLVAVLSGTFALMQPGETPVAVGPVPARDAAPSKEPVSAPRTPQAPTSTSSRTSQAGDPEVQAPAGFTLNERLERYKAWHAAWEREKEKLGDKLKLDQAFAIEFHRTKTMELVRDLEGIDQLIFEDPDRFLAFLRNSENEECINTLVIHAFGAVTPGVQVVKFPRDRYPVSLLEGMLGLLDSASHAQKVAGLSFFAHVINPPDAFYPRFNSLIEGSDSRTQQHVLMNIWGYGFLKPETEAAVLRAGRNATELATRTAVIQALNWVQDSGVQNYLLERMEQSTQPEEIGLAALALTSRISIAQRGGLPLDEKRYFLAAHQALGRMDPSADDGYVKYLIHPALQLNLTTMRPLIVRAAEAARTEESRAALRDVLNKMDEGVTEPAKLQALLWPKR